MAALLEFLEKRSDSVAVIFDDLKRFARDTIFHLQLRQELAVRSAYPMCPNFRFEDTPEGTFVETVIAATAELERKQNRRQVLSRMKARFSEGFWVFPAPTGYRFESGRGQYAGLGRVLMPDPGTADPIREALERFADGRLAKQADVERFLEARGCIGYRSRGKTVGRAGVAVILRNPLYAGVCVLEKWGLRVMGKHEPLISIATHRRILERLEGAKKVMHRRGQTKSAFPLRGLIVCAHCGRKMTAAWSRGKSGGHYGYYRCVSNGCLTVRREEMEEAFLRLLAQASVPSSVIELFEVVLRELLSDRKKLVQVEEAGASKRKQELEAELLSLAEALRLAPTDSVRKIYQTRMIETDRALAEVAGRSNGGQDRSKPQGFQAVLQLLLEKGRRILLDPMGSWKNAGLDRRLLIQELVFAGGLTFHRKSGFTTPSLSLLFGLFQGSRVTNDGMVDTVREHFNSIMTELERWETLLNAALTQIPRIRKNSQAKICRAVETCDRESGCQNNRFPQIMSQLSEPTQS